MRPLGAGAEHLMGTVEGPADARPADAKSRHCCDGLPDMLR